jgi:hypothetical protein
MPRHLMPYAVWLTRQLRVSYASLTNHRAAMRIGGHKALGGQSRPKHWQAKRWVRLDKEDPEPEKT